MAGAVLRFLATLSAQAWRWGVSRSAQVARWVRANWRIVLVWIQRGATFYGIVETVLRILGIG